MLKRWVVYLFILAGAFAFYGIYEQYASYFIMFAVILFPLFSLIISLFGMLRVRAAMNPLPIEIKRGDIVEAVIGIFPRSKLPLAHIRITYTAQNITLNEVMRRKTVNLYGCTESFVPLYLDTSHIGTIYLAVKRIKVYDYLGLFGISLEVPVKRHIIIMPDFTPPCPMPVLPVDKTAGKGLKPKPGGGFAEDYDLREYRIGDPLNLIHWKLTSKLDQLITREPLVSEKGKLFICFNLFGTPDELDSAFGQIAYISHVLFRRMIEYSLCWYGKDGSLNIFEIKEKSDLQRFFVSVFSQPIDLTGKEIDSRAYRDADWHYTVRPLVFGGGKAK